MLRRSSLGVTDPVRPNCVLRGSTNLTLICFVWKLYSFAVFDLLMLTRMHAS
jgi:hypothetical protein